VSAPAPAALRCHGRTFEVGELALVRDLVTSGRGLSRRALARTVCERLDWRRANGTAKLEQARALLEALEARGHLELPALRPGRPRGARTKVPHTPDAEPAAPITARLRDLAPLSLRLVRTNAERARWRELIARYHYLGHAVPFGAHLRYLIEVAQPAPSVVGCLQLSSPAWKMAARERWIGWSEPMRAANLQRIVSNSRFLIVPWVEVRNLASSVLARLARRLADDWQHAYATRPVLLETLVDAQRFTGTCYRAANWIPLGTTAGRGRFDRHHRRHGREPKHLFVYPLVRHARAVLRGEHP